MSKMVNEALISGLARELEDIDSCVAIGPRGLTVADAEELRNRLREQNVRMRFIKNSLAKVALERTSMKGVGEVLDGPSALLFGGDGALAISKLIVEEAKKLKEKIVIHGGYFEGEVLDSDGVDQLSKAPSREEGLAMVLAGLFGPVSELCQGMNGLLNEMHGLFEALANEKGGGEEG